MLVSSLRNNVAVTAYYADDGTVSEMPNEVSLSLTAIWDTGAERSVISDKVAAELGLKPISMVNVITPTGAASRPLHRVRIFLPNQVAVEAEASQCPLTGFDILIGMDIIGQGDFIVSNFGGQTLFTFRVPSLHNYDFVHNNYLPPARAIKTPGRNDPCFCGSGKKYKECHGK